MSVSRDKIDAALEDVWLETLKERLKNFYNNEVVEDSKTAGDQLRNSLRELRQAHEESVMIIDEFFRR